MFLLTLNVKEKAVSIEETAMFMKTHRENLEETRTYASMKELAKVEVTVQHVALKS